MTSRTNLLSNLNLLGLFGLATATLSGCTLMGDKATTHNTGKPVTTSIAANKSNGSAPVLSQVAAAWENRVVYTPDPTRGGAMSPGLAGRVYLFGPELGHPLNADGTLTVDLYDHTPAMSGGQAVMLERWNIDKDTLTRLQKRDMIGAGYTVFLPWSTYRPDIKQIQLRLAFAPVTGNPLFAPPSTLNIAGGGAVTNTVQHTNVPGAMPKIGGDITTAGGAGATSRR